jgi:hypothetical protein
METRSISKTETFDPACDGFGFQNPVGWVPDRTGGGTFLRRFDPLLYGRGLCFGMATASLLYFADRTKVVPLADLPPTPTLLETLRKYHLQQYGPRTVFATVRDWVASCGGKPERVLERLRLVEANYADPHILCFGPGLNRRFFTSLARAHAVVPYRVEEGRVYVYDPNYPQDRERFVEFRREDGSVEFTYGGFRSREGWGITLVPVFDDALSGTHTHLSAHTPPSRH